MTKKITLAIYDNSLKAEIGKYEVSDDGSKIKVKSGGDAHFMPSFDNDSFIELPNPRWKVWMAKYTRYYFVKKKGKKCVNFKTGVTYGPDPEQVKEAIGSTLLGKIGQDQQELSWWNWAVLALVVFSVLIQMGVFQ